MVKSFVQPLEAHDGNADSLYEVSRDMSLAFIKGVKENLPSAQITFDKFYVLEIVNETVDKVRQKELKKNRYL